MKEGKQSSTVSSTEFSLAVAVRALAASTVSYLEPHSRGMTFAAYDTIVKDTLLPPFSAVVSIDQCGRDISRQNVFEEAAKNDAPVEQPLNEDGQDIVTNGKEVRELQERFNGDYELYEKYDRSGKQKVRCLIAAVHGTARKRSEGAKNNEDTGDAKGLEFLPGSISITFRGTDTLQNVLADVRALTVQYDDPPFIPDGVREEKCNESEMKMKYVTVHNGFRDAWYGDELRQTTLQYAYDKLSELNNEIKEAQSLGLTMAPLAVNNETVPTIDIVGHSLGGSIAVLAAFDLAKSLHYIDSSKQAHIRAYTMGCPRVGNVQFAKLFNQLVPECWNIINDNDIVPAIPYTATAVRSSLPVFCPCSNYGYRRHGKAVILKESGRLIINPSRRMKYRREAKVLRLKKAIDSHMTSEYRDNIRAAIRNKMDEKTRQEQLQKEHQKSVSSWNGKTGGRRKHEHTEEEAGWKELDDLLDRLGRVIDEALSNPNRSFRLLPGGT